MDEFEIYQAHEDLFRSKTRKEGNGCVTWTGTTLSSGYGLFSFPRGAFGEHSSGKNRGQKNVRAHRYAISLKIGRIPESNEFTCHTCDNPPCVNPEHLWLGTPEENYMDMRGKGRFTGKQKLSMSDVVGIYQSNETVARLSDKYGVGKGAIWNIWSGKAWIGVTRSLPPRNTPPKKLGER